MKKILLISPNRLPIPAVQGGAIETLITNLLYINENEGRCRFIVTSQYSEDAKKKKYKYSKVVYLFDGDYEVGFPAHMIGLLWLIYRSCFVLFQNSHAKKIIGQRWHEVSKRTFFYYIITYYYHVDVIVNEGGLNELESDLLREVVGKENIYNHIHYNRPEDIPARKKIPNSICISDFVRKDWAVTPGMEGRNAVLLNGIDLARFTQRISAEKRRELRKSFGANEKTILVVFCGRIMKVKGVKELLDAFARLDNSPIKLLLIGSAEFSRGTVTEFSKEMQKRANSMDNVISLGYVPNEKMSELYQCADIQVIPSIGQEGAGLVAIEGMASGLPLITTISGGMTEYVTDETAIQLPIDEHLSDNLAKAILELAQDKQKRERMGKVGMERAKQFSKEKFYQDFINIVLNGENGDHHGNN